MFTNKSNLVNKIYKNMWARGKKCINNILENKKNKNENYYSNFVKQFGSIYEN